MICWYCYWGWPKQVADIYDEYGADGLDYGPGHAVWADENFETSSINIAIKYCNQGEGDEQDRDALIKLLYIPEEIRCCCPEEYDNEHPENYPPPPGIEMVKR